MVSEISTVSRLSTTINCGNEDKSDDGLGTIYQSDEEDEDEDYTHDGQVISKQGDFDRLEEVPTFGSVSVVNSNDVHFGNKTFYHGPVTIKQFLYGNDNAVHHDAIVNKGFEGGCVNGECDSVDYVATNDNSSKQIESYDQNCKHPDRSDHSAVLKGLQRLQKFSQENIFILVTVFIIITLSGFILTIVLLLRHTPLNAQSHGSNWGTNSDIDEPDVTQPIDAPLDPEANLTLPAKVRLATRLDWVAQPALHPVDPLLTPVPYVIIHHTATENCSSQAQCILHVRKIQQYHIESNGWWDIGYNFLVGGDGEAYEGRGWKGEGAHTFGFNKQSIGIAFIGTFMTIKPPNRQIVVCKKLIAMGVNMGYIKKDYKLYAVRQLETTQSPGSELYDDIKSWDHWSSDGPVVN